MVKGNDHVVSFSTASGVDDWSAFDCLIFNPSMRAPISATSRSIDAISMDNQSPIELGHGDLQRVDLDKEGRRWATVPRWVAVPCEARLPVR